MEMVLQTLLAVSLTTHTCGKLTYFLTVHLNMGQGLMVKEGTQSLFYRITFATLILIGQ